MKYIDAEKFREKLTEQMESVPCEVGRGAGTITSTGYGMIQAFQIVRSIIDSLQQEQPLPCWIHANYSSKPEVRYTPSGVPYLQNRAYMIWLSDLETLPKDGTDLINLMQEQTKVDLVAELKHHLATTPKEQLEKEWKELESWANIGPTVQEFLYGKQPEVDLEKFTEKIKTFQARYTHPEIVSIKSAMAFMARMFYQYPNVARQWYEQLPKATMD